MKRAAVIIAKAPVPGRVKTRLCPPCDGRQAAAIAEAAIEQTLEAVAAARVDRRVIALDGASGAWVPRDFEVVKQRGAGLGRRLANALADVGGPAVLVGMDSPQITPRMIEDSLDALEHADAAIGPTWDGGYWSIALRAADERVFIGVPMSTSSTFTSQVARLRALGLTWSRLPRLRDVDCFCDALIVASQIPGSRFAAAVHAVEVARQAAS